MSEPTSAKKFPVSSITTAFLSYSTIARKKICSNVDLGIQSVIMIDSDLPPRTKRRGRCSAPMKSSLACTMRGRYAWTLWPMPRPGKFLMGWLVSPSQGQHHSQVCLRLRMEARRCAKSSSLKKTGERRRTTRPLSCSWTAIESDLATTEATPAKPNGT